MRILISVFFALLAASPAYAKTETCNIEQRSCVISVLLREAEKVENPSWRDQTYREIAKTLAADGQFDQAIGLVDKIVTPDTQAMTIRGIGMAAADLNLSPENHAETFQKLRARAEKIEHPPSYAIALTYIAMAQAFARDNEGAWKTALDMENDALRHKAFGETAEIQAEHGDYEAVVKSIAYIDSPAFRNKAYSNTSKIFADRGQFAPALKTAEKIDNPYKKAQALQYVLDVQSSKKDGAP